MVASSVGEGKVVVGGSGCGRPETLQALLIGAVYGRVIYGYVRALACLRNSIHRRCSARSRHCTDVLGHCAAVLPQREDSIDGLWRIKKSWLRHEAVDI